MIREETKGIGEVAEVPKYQEKNYNGLCMLGEVERTMSEDK